MTQPGETQAIMQGEHYWVKPPRAATDQKSCHDCGKPYEDHVLSVKLKKTRPQLTAHKLDYPINFRELTLDGPTVFYIDESGNLIEAVMSDQQKQEVVKILQSTYEVQQ